MKEFLIHNPLIELGLVTLILVFIGYGFRILKQPILIGYIVGGLLLGPEVFDLISHYDNIAFYAHFGVSLLLFMVGLGLNPAIVKEVGKVATIAGVGQVVFTFCFGFGIALLLGFTPIVAAFIAIALTFSSTIMIVKLVSDRGDSGTTYGKIALGVLIVQDIIAMLILLTISATTMQSGDGQSWMFLARIIGSIGLLLGFARAAAKWILPGVMRALSKEKELLLLFVITRAIVLGGLWYYAGFSMEIGALLAGVTLASSRYRFHIFSELRPFRDFFLALFFVYLGGKIVFDSMESMIIPIVLLSAFVLIGNPIIIISLMMRLGYNRKDSFMTGLTVAQISEFSFIIIGLALTAGTLNDPAILSMVTIIGLITMTGSSYMFANAEKLYSYVAPRLKRFEKKHTSNALEGTSTGYQIVIVGYGRLGKFMAAKLTHSQLPFCIIDHDPLKLKEAEEVGYTVFYGDVTDNDLLEHVLDTSTEIVYSTIENYDIGLHILMTVKGLHAHTRIILLAHYLDEAESLYEKGADYVIFPHLFGAHESWSMLEKHIAEPEMFFLHKVKNREALQVHRSFLD